MQELRIGDAYQPVVGRGEGCFFDFDDAGAKLIYSYNRPTAEEIADMSSGKPFEIRYMETGGIIWTAHKCGGQQWNDCPYNPRLSLLNTAARLRETPLSADAYLRTLADVPRRYTSRQIADICPHYCKIRGGA